MSFNQEDLEQRTRDWTAPPELAASPPRAVRYTGFGILAMILSVAMVAGGIALGFNMRLQSTAETASMRLLNEQGAEIDATVTSLSRKTGKNRAYRVAYEFRAGGSVYHGNSSISRPVWEKLSEGGRLRVRYLPVEPMINRPLDSPDRSNPSLLAWVLPVFFTFLAAFMTLRVRRQRRLLEDGRPAPGVVTDVRRTKNGRSVRYDFLLPGGSRASGRGLVRGKAPNVSDLVTVVYDPDDPAKNGPYPFEFTRIAQ